MAPAKGDWSGLAHYSGIWTSVVASAERVADSIGKRAFVATANEARWRQNSAYTLIHCAAPAAKHQHRSRAALEGALRSTLTGQASIGDRGNDAGWFREALAACGTAACILSKGNRLVAIPQGAELYRLRRKVEVAFGRLKD